MKIAGFNALKPCTYLETQVCVPLTPLPPLCAVMLKYVVSSGRCAAWVSGTKRRRGAEKETFVGSGDESFDITDADHREFVSAGVAAGIAVRLPKRDV